ncbi:GntR family transcriptional regulator [Dactylosporangium sp. AC04546]|uniref:GntR family transcriptional regulator n=1 Tax=Dactylosporangium sp. AC04546 TaxID=2862460 RepID=UPI001EDF6931|nr:GntR family transcriptional regulator [Dactylosporangium sp. AC04546]WVK88648.1 GntR family transcriptional regulator [Dactylosporangium sp. AC04546]
MAALAQYERIVVDIRTRIADGRLTPGDRLPSTRQLAKDWGVALATATKALTALQQQGIVVSQPRVGTVVAGVAGAAPGTPADAPLSREQVVRAAIELADAEGLDALSMRGVAARLGVATMSTYRHVTSKDQLILLMADTAFGEPVEVAGAGEPGGWRDLLTRAARTMWALYRRHPWLAHVTPLTRPLPLPNLVAHGERMLAAFQAVGAFDPQSLQDLQVLVYSHVQGLAMQLEGEARALADTGLDEDEWMAVNGAGFSGITGSGRYPRFTALMAAFGEAGGYDLDLDELFELGLGVLLDGLAVRFADPDRRRDTRRR